MVLVILLLGILSPFCGLSVRAYLKFRSSDKHLGIISLMYITHTCMPISKYNKYFTTS